MQRKQLVVRILAGCASVWLGYGIADVLALGDSSAPDGHSHEVTRDHVYDCSAGATLTVQLAPSRSIKDADQAERLELEVAVASHLVGERDFAYSLSTHSDSGTPVTAPSYSSIHTLSAGDRASLHTEVPSSLSDGFYRTTVRVLTNASEEARASISYRVVKGSIEVMNPEEWEQTSRYNYPSDERG